MRYFRFVLALAVSVAACDGGEPDEPTTASVYVGNQGNFSDNNGSLTLYDPDTGDARQNAVPDLGGLVRALTIGNDQLYVLLNFSDSFSTGSGRIDVVDFETNARTAQIEVSTPRAMAVSGSTAWVTNLYSNTVTPINLDTNTPGTPVPVGANPEGVVTVGSRVYVANYGFGESTTLSVVNTPANTTTLDVGCDGPRALLVDAEREVWVFCTGRTLFDESFNVIGQTGGAVVVLDGATGAERARIALAAPLGSASFGQDAAYSSAREEAWTVSGTTLLRFDTSTNTLSEEIEAGGALVGGLAYDDVSDRLYVARLDAANPFSAAGSVTVHTRDGAQTGRFAAGLIPSAFAFAE